MKLNNKKGMALQTIIGLVLVLVTGTLISTFLFSTSDVVSSSIEDEACRTYVHGKATTIGKTADFFKGIDLKCKKEEVKIKTDNKEEVFKEVSKYMMKCWYRYGEGEKDFLSNYGTEGNWCFTCAKLDFKSNDESYDYTKEFVPWLQKNTYTLRNGSKKKYDEVLQLKYFSNENNELESVVEAVDNLNVMIEENDKDLQPFLIELSKQSVDIFDLAQKKIDTSEEMFVVYRYDRLDKNIYELLTDVGTSVAVTLAAETITYTVVGGTLGTVVPLAGNAIGASIGFLAGATKGTFKIIKLKKLGDKAVRIYEIMGKLGKGIRFLKKGAIIGTGVGGAVASGTLAANHNVNNVQYVDVLNKEQYYRLCGTETMN